MKKLVLSIVAMCSVLLCLAQGFPQMNADPSKGLYSFRFSDVNYVGDDQVYHNMDIYLPLGAESSQSPKVVIAIYGSAWFSNNAKSMTMSSIGNALLKAGFAVVSINHRSSMDAPWPAQIQDVKAAIRFVRANASKYGYDASSVGITGFSSGGHLSSFAAATNGEKQLTSGAITIDIEGSLGNFTSTSSAVDAVVDWFGPIDMATMNADCSGPNDASSPEAMLIGKKDPRQEPDWVKLISSPYYVDSSDPQILIIHGTADTTVPNCQSHTLKAAYDAAGVKATLIEVEGGGHGPGCFDEQYYSKMIEYFKMMLN